MEIIKFSDYNSKDKMNEELVISDEDTRKSIEWIIKEIGNIKVELKDIGSRLHTIENHLS